MEKMPPQKVIFGGVNLIFKVSNPQTDELQRKIAMISEMFHTSSLYHDDVIDNADKRRGKPSVNLNWTPSQVTIMKIF